MGKGLVQVGQAYDFVAREEDEAVEQVEEQTEEMDEARCSRRAVDS